MINVVKKTVTCMIDEFIGRFANDQKDYIKTFLHGTETESMKDKHLSIKGRISSSFEFKRMGSKLSISSRKSTDDSVCDVDRNLTTHQGNDDAKITISDYIANTIQHFEYNNYL